MLINELLHFIERHGLLFSSWLIVLILWVITYENKSIKGVPMVEAQHAVTLINHQGATLVDVRHEQQFKAEHALHAVHLSLDESVFQQKLKRLKLSKKKPLIVYGSSQGEVLAAVKLLRGEEFEQIYGLNGSLKQWKQESLPVV